MHKWAKEILKCVKSKVDEMGLEAFEGQNLDDLKDWTEIVKNIAKFDKDYRIVEAMGKAEDEEIMEMLERYEDYPERRYYDAYRYKTSGKYAPKGKGTYVGRRGYEEPLYHVSPEMYKSHSAEYWRDLDRRENKMYFSEKEMSNESNYDKARRMYTEAKDIHKDNSPESKQAKLKELEKYMQEISTDISSLINDASADEKTMIRNKLQVLASKVA